MHSADEAISFRALTMLSFEPARTVMQVADVATHLRCIASEQFTTGVTVRVCQ